MPDHYHHQPQTPSGRRASCALTGVLTYLIPVHDVLADTVSEAFVTGSGFTAIGQIGTLLKPTCLALAFFWAVWGIISEARAMSASDGDSASLGGAVIRGALLPVLLTVLITTLA